MEIKNTVEVETFMTIKGLSEYIKLATGTIYNKIARNGSPYFKTGGSVRFKKSEIDNWAKINRPKFFNQENTQNCVIDTNNQVKGERLIVKEPQTG